MTVAQHRSASEDLPVRCGIVTVSDSRTKDTDRGGPLIARLLEAGGHEVTLRRLVPDERSDIEAAFNEAAASCEAVIFTGGTGLSARDQTVDVIAAGFDRQLPGFGELFRMLSWKEVGAASMLSRATAGARGQTIVFCLPGSPNAIRLAMEQLILPELRHLVWELRHKDEAPK